MFIDQILHYPQKHSQIEIEMEKRERESNAKPIKKQNEDGGKINDDFIINLKFLNRISANKIDGMKENQQNPKPETHLEHEIYRHRFIIVIHLEAIVLFYVLCFKH